MATKSLWTCVSFAALVLIPGHPALADEAGCLVIGAWDEARGEPVPVVEAVLSTIVNRAHARGTSVCDAVLDQSSLSGVTPAMNELFSQAAKPHGGTALQPRNEKDRAQLAAVLAAAERAVAGTLPDRTHGATHFYSPAGRRELGLTDQPGWAGAMEQTASVGPFVFMREKAPPVTDAALTQPREHARPEAPAPVAAPVTPAVLPAAQLDEAAKQRIAPSDPIFALAPPPPAPPLSSIEIKKLELGVGSLSSSHMAAPSVAALPAGLANLPAEPEEEPIVPVRSASMPTAAMHTAPLQTAAVMAAPPVIAQAPVVAQAPSAAQASVIAQVAAASGWVAPPSPYDPSVAPQVAHASQMTARFSVPALPRAMAVVQPAAIRVRPAPLPPAARPTAAAPAAAPQPAVMHAAGKTEIASFKPPAVKSMTLNVKPLTPAALQAPHAAVYSVPLPPKPTVKVATVVLDPPHFLTLPTEAPRVMTEAPLEAAPQRAEPQPAEPQFEAQVADNGQYRQQDQYRQQEEPAPTEAAQTEPAQPMPLYDAPRAAPRQDETVETVTEETTEAPQPADQSPGYRSPAYQPPAYQPPAYQSPGYPAPAYSAPGYQQAPRYAPPGYAAAPQRWGYWNQQPTYAPPRAPAGAYWPSYRPAALSADCPAWNRRVVWVQVQRDWGEPKLVKRRVCIQ